MSYFHTLQEIVSQDRFPEWMTGVSTLLLFISTILLVIVTKQLATITREDGRYRRYQATTDAWSKVRANADLPDLRREVDKTKVVEQGLIHRPLLREMESYALCINAGVYDIRIFNRISGSWFITNVEKIWPYIKVRQDELPHRPYSEIAGMYHQLVTLRKGKANLVTGLSTQRSSSSTN